MQVSALTEVFTRYYTDALVSRVLSCVCVSLQDVTVMISWLLPMRLLLQHKQW